jgi:serine/threonine protein kinase
MAVPATSVSEFLALVRKSGLLDGAGLDDYVKRLQEKEGLPDKPGELAGYFVRDEMLTRFQAEQLLLGKWRGFSISKFKILDRLGSGGMGNVFLGEHKMLRRKMALKLLPPSRAENPSALERFYREARAVAALDHPNIVKAFDIDREDNLHFLVMEYIDGRSLQELVKKEGPLDPVRAADYIRQAALGLGHAHEMAGLVHRDIKPGNILVSEQGVVKILDMGLARFFYDDGESISKKYSETVLGTADYLAPEQGLLNRVDIRADIYSLGATFYFVLTAAPPFGRGTPSQKLIWHQVRRPRPIRTLRPEVPESLTLIVEKMMAKDPGERYQTPAALAEALAAWLQQANGRPPSKNGTPNPVAR